MGEKKQFETAEGSTAGKEKKKTHPKTHHKKETIPTKTTLNLYYKEDKASSIATIGLYAVFVLVLCLAALKFGVFDLYAEAKEMETKVADMQTYSDTLLIALKDYNTVKGEYDRYTQAYLTDEELLEDRIALLNMLEETVFAESTCLSANILDDTIFISYEDLKLDETSTLVRFVEEYECVKQVDVQTAELTVDSDDGKEKVTTSMIIELHSLGGSEEEAEEVPVDEE